MTMPTNPSSRYTLLDKIGEGGMGEVFRGCLPGKPGVVAIKRLRADRAEDAEQAAMFAREIRLCAELQHPNIVSVLDVSADEDGRAWLVMEYVDGVDLARLHRLARVRGPFSVGLAVHVSAEILRALSYAHARGIVHRDVTPHNVLVARSGAVKLSDFGVAWSGTASRTGGHTLVGKLPYISPEQLHGCKADGRADLFAVGVTLYKLLTDELPFGDFEREAMAVAQVLTTPVRPPSKLRPELPPELDRIVLRLLARDREERYQTADEVLHELERFGGDRSKLMALMAELVPPESTDEADEQARTRRRWRWPRMRALLAAAAALCSTALAVAVAARYMPPTPVDVLAVPLDASAVQTALTTPGTPSSASTEPPGPAPRFLAAWWRSANPAGDELQATDRPKHMETTPTPTTTDEPIARVPACVPAQSPRPFARELHAAAKHRAGRSPSSTRTMDMRSVAAFEASWRGIGPARWH